jgi:hypothetical protein
MKFTDAVTVNVDPDVLFAYVGNVEKLPQYLPRIADAQRVEGEAMRIFAKPTGDGTENLLVEAWLRLLPERHLEWGAAGRANYHGEASVIATDEGSLLMVSLNLDQADSTIVNRELAEALQRIKKIVEGGSAH